MTNQLLIAVAFIVGALVPFQMTFNAQLGGVTKSPYTAGLIIFLVGAVACLIVLLTLRAPMPRLADMMDAPKTIWLGGVIATLYILAVVVVTPRLGVALTASLIIVGQLVAAVLLDHFGVLGGVQHSLNLWRVAGVLLMIAGVVAIKTH